MSLQNTIRQNGVFVSLYPWHPIPWHPPYPVVSEFLVLNGSLKQFRMFGQFLASKKKLVVSQKPFDTFPLFFSGGHGLLFRHVF